MRAVGLALAILAMTAGSLAGCVGSAEPTDAPVASVATITAVPNQGILLRVLVITDEYFPVPKAKVMLVGLGVNGTTDDWGDAYFHIAKPGRYALHVHRSGFYPNQTKIVLEESDRKPTIRIRLIDAPRDGHFADFYYYAGLCGPAAFVQGGTATADCGEAPNFPPPRARFIIGRGVTSGYLELNWDEHAGGAEAMRMEVRYPELGPFADGRSVLVAEGASPVKIHIPDEMFTEQHRTNGHVLTVGVGLARDALLRHNVQQDFHIEAEFNYFIAAPDVDEED